MATKAKLRARVAAKLKKAEFRLSSLALVEQVTVKDKIDGKSRRTRYSIPVSIFRRQDLFSKKTRQLKRGVGREAVDLVSQAYQAALTGVAYSRSAKSLDGRSVQDSMVWPGKHSRSKPSSVTMKTSGGLPLDRGANPVPDTAIAFKGYTSSTLRTYHTSRKYLFKVAGLRQFRRPAGKGQFKPAHLQSVRNRNKFAFDARRVSIEPNKTAKVVQAMLGPTSPAVSAAANLTLGSITSRKISKNGRLPARYKAIRQAQKVRNVVPLATVEGPVNGFGKAVKAFAQGEALFVTPFLTGEVPSLKRSIKFTKTAGQQQTQAVLTKNELERPYVRKFMANMNEVMIEHVSNKLRR